ncbi:MAG TPA: 50S ribosomal protein L6 [Candidatus Thermoplasmatota archaeon]|nr:50S ribosomal protein L6 [Candidatus Thermoplasmatota archaeon]
MVQALAKETIPIPKGVTVTVEDRDVKVKGPKGELVRAFPEASVALAQQGDELVVSCELPRRRQKALVGTYASHLRNMVSGVQAEWEYKLKIVFSHFPIKTKVQGKQFVIENFLGEKTPRRASIREGVAVKVEGDAVSVTGVHLENVAQTAANIEQATRIRGFDPRVFQDGIYITHKPR